MPPGTRGKCRRVEPEVSARVPIMEIQREFMCVSGCILHHLPVCCQINFNNKMEMQIRTESVIHFMFKSETKHCGQTNIRESWEPKRIKGYNAKSKYKHMQHYFGQRTEKSYFYFFDYICERMLDVFFNI